MLVSAKEMLEDAHAHGYAIPSPDFLDSNSVRAYAQVAGELHAPLILSFAEVHLEHLSIEEAALLGKFYAERVDAPVALHLDHGVTMPVIEEAIERGFTSVMIDASKEELAVNIQRTKEVCELAHAHGVTVEAEIGHVGTEEEGNDHALADNVYTEVAAAKELVEATGVDSLAVSVGTKHGAYKGTPHINFERLADIAQRYADSMASITVKSTDATHPQNGMSFGDLGETDQMEIGAGQHGEGGGVRVPMASSKETVELIAPKLVEHVGLQEGDKAFVMINGCGATTLMEQLILYKDTVRYLESLGVEVVANMVGEILTVQESGGFQMNIAKWDDEFVRLWNTPAHTPVFFKE